jgi:hypothetical protein
MLGEMRAAGSASRNRDVRTDTHLTPDHHGTLCLALNVWMRHFCDWRLEVKLWIKNTTALDHRPHYILITEKTWFLLLGATTAAACRREHALR